MTVKEYGERVQHSCGGGEPVAHVVVALLELPDDVGLEGGGLARDLELRSGPSAPWAGVAIEHGREDRVGARRVRPARRCRRRARGRPACPSTVNRTGCSLAAAAWAVQTSACTAASAVSSVMPPGRRGRSERSIVIVRSVGGRRRASTPSAGKPVLVVGVVGAARQGLVDGDLEVAVRRVGARCALREQPRAARGRRRRSRPARVTVRAGGGSSRRLRSDAVGRSDRRPAAVVGLLLREPGATADHRRRSRPRRRR